MRDTWPSRVISEDELAALEEEDRGRAARRREAMERWRQAASELKSGLSTEELCRVARP